MDETVLTLASAFNRFKHYSLIDYVICLLFLIALVKLGMFKKNKNKLMTDLAKGLSGIDHDGYIEFKFEAFTFKLFFEMPRANKFAPAPPSHMDLIFELKKSALRTRVVYNLQNDENRIKLEEINRIFNLQFFEEIEINSEFLVIRKYTRPPKSIDDVNSIASAIKSNMSAIKSLVEKINI